MSERAIFVEQESERNFPEDKALENGNYTNLCCNCEEWFIGHKRRVLSRVCENCLYRNKKETDTV